MKRKNTSNAGQNKKKNDPRPRSAVLGMKNPVAGLSEEEARAIAAELGNGQDMGSWRTMSGEQFLAWWQQSNNAKPSDPPDKS